MLKSPSSPQTLFRPFSAEMNALTKDTATHLASKTRLCLITLQSIRLVGGLMKWQSILIVCMLLLSILSILSVSNGTPSPVKAVISAYTSHTPIYINDNSGFTNASGIVWGSGTVSDPYIIGGWSIDASASPDCPIYIVSTDSFFIIENCYLRDTSSSAIAFAAVSNGAIINNNCSNSVRGMEILSCSNNIISNNTCLSNSQSGIYLVNSNDNGIFNNSCWYTNGAGPDEIGIHLISSSNNIIANNSCLFNGGSGIADWQSGSNTIANNNCGHNGAEGIYCSNSDTVLIRKNNCTSNSDKGIVIADSSHAILSENICMSDNSIGVWVTRSDHCSLSNNSCKNNNFAGIYTDSYDGSSKFNNITNNICIDNQYGIYLLDSNHNTVRNNNCSYNVLFGIRLESSSYNEVWNNTFIGNNGAESVYDSAHVQAIEYDDSMFFGGFVETNHWNTSGSPHGYGNYWGDWTVPDNNRDGIVDAPYDTIGDLYPLVSPPGVDITPPFTTCSISGTIGLNGWYVSDITVTFYAIDNYSGVNHTGWSIDTVTYAASYDEPLTFQLVGLYNLSFHSFDNAGNPETIKRIQIKQDTNAPFSSANRSGQLFTISAIDNTSGVDRTMYRIDNGTWLNYNRSFNIEGAGNHTIEYYSIDNAGNREDIKIAYQDNGNIDVTLITLIALLIVSAIGISLFLIRNKQKEILPPPDE